MALNTTTPRVEYTASSSQVQFTFSFKVFDDTDLLVYQTPTGQTANDETDILTLTTDYTVTIDGDDGGYITLTSGATSGDKITLTRSLVVVRETDYQQGGDILADVIDNDQNYQTYMIQDLNISKTRYIQLPNSLQGTSNVLPSPNADYYIKWNSSGNALENDETIPQNVQLAIDSASAAATSETNAATSESNAETYKNNAASSASASAASASDSATYASNSASSASAAATSESNASSSASTAASHLAAIEAIYDNFDDRFLGAKSSDPTLDNDGNALQVGAIYFNTTEDETRFYNGSSWERPEYTSTQAASAASASASAAATSESNASASASAASISESNASTSESNASDSATLAEEYATQDEDVYVTGTTDYSAYHWAKKAQDSASGVTYEALDAAGDIGFGSSQIPQGSDVQSALDLKANQATTYTKTEVDTAKQDTLVSGTNIKTLDGVSILGEGDVSVVYDYTAFVKPDSEVSLFTKVSPSSISIPSGFKVKVNDTLVELITDVTLTLADDLDTGVKTAGTDYYVYAKEDSTFYLSADKTITADRLIGGFHYGLTGESEAPTGNKTEADMVKIRGINAYSMWDLKFRPNCNPEGMAYINGKWYDIYLLNSEHITNGTSKANLTIAGGVADANGRAIPKIPLEYGGNGTITYGKFTWFQACEIGKAHNKEMISYAEFPTITYGVNEQKSSQTNAYETVVGKIEHYSNLTSKYGIEQATGVQWIWGSDVQGIGADGWKTGLTDGRGDIYAYANQPTAVLLGGNRADGVSAGSRASSWGGYVWSSAWGIGSRFACDHLKLV